MFERNRIDNVEMTSVVIEVGLDDGRTLAGKCAIPPGRHLFDVLNGNAAFIDFEPFDGERAFIAKSSLRTVRLLQVPRGVDLPTRLRDLDGFDPRGVLGVATAATWDEIRAAYLALTKKYHPDRYSSAELPQEVRDYLAAMARRVNAAYAALETTQQSVKRVARTQAEAVYARGMRG